MMSEAEFQLNVFMDEFLEQNPTHTSPPKMKIKKNSVLVASGAITFLLVIGVMAAVNISMRNADPRSDASNEDTDKYEKREFAPFEHADKSLPTEPAILSADEYHQLYLKVRETFVKRDYDGFKKLASAQRVWQVEHPVKLIPPEDESIVIAGESTNVPGPENFFLNVIQGIQFQALPIDKIKAVEVKKRPELEGSHTTQEVNKKNKSKDKVKFTNWKYAVDVVYQPTDDSPDKGTGQVTFVYDKDHWAYQGEFWQIIQDTSPQQYGDQTPATIEMDFSSNGFQASIDIIEGQSVSWKNLTGLIYSTGRNETPWNTNYLWNDTFTKTFTDKGKHEYRIFWDKGDSVETLEGVINVQ